VPRLTKRSKADGRTIVFHTALGSLYVQLYEKQAPHTTAHILRLVEGGHYNSGSFYRAEAEYIVQAGRVRITSCR